MTRGAVEEAVVELIAGWDREVARPDRKDLAVGDGQAHLVAVAEGRVGLGIARRLVVGRRTDDVRLAGDRVDGRLGRVGVGLGAEGLAAVDAGGDVGRDPGVGGVVAGIAPRDDHVPGRLVDRDLRLELGPAGD